ncbi:PhlD [Streptomyces sp. A1277]|uniref:type III polyketide synthase n=1 Tax=Streptomyces sp. A1277 TaxID=2563103 RepID=UPI0010A23E60|nr:3-oxoacyl-[acyl-carrier-protein] synthase III C-terminal domain-containing protein [Streptomyces sp. A1277]THA29225.1 PhlD [Streptomyces sp. A1277]
MPAHVTAPHVVLPAHKVSTDEILEDIRTRHHDHPRLEVILRAIRNCGVQNRFFARPLQSPTVAGDTGVAERMRAAFGDALTMATEAADRAITAAGLQPGDITAVVTSHATGYSVPNLDVHLIAALGLPPTTRRLPMTSLACAGGVHTLIRAHDHVTARPDARVLVVTAECLSTSYNHTDTSIPSMIYKALFADSAAATIVTADQLQPGLRIDDTLEYTLPDSLDRYTGRLDETGMHFDSTRAAPQSAGQATPALRDWLGQDLVDWAVIHPGGPSIIHDVAEALGLDNDDAHHSYTSLAECGNLGGPSVLDILARTHTTPPHPGDLGVAAAFGPGFTMSAVRGIWQN